MNEATNSKAILEIDIDNMQLIDLFNSKIVEINKSAFGVSNLKHIKIVFPLLWVSVAVMVIGACISIGVL